jgi:hypothetical protein
LGQQSTETAYQRRRACDQLKGVIRTIKEIYTAQVVAAAIVLNFGRLQA